MAQSKTCKKCGAAKDASEFRAGRHACKACDRERQRKVDAANAERIRARKQKWYAANFESEMARMKAHRIANTEHINETRRAGYAENAKQVLERNNAWRKAHHEYKPAPEAIERKKIRRKQRDIDNAETLAAYSKNYYAANAQARRANSAKWAQANPEKALNQNRRRRAQKKAAPGSHTAEEWCGLVSHFEGYCLCCKKHFGLRKLTEDHVIPLTRGGSDRIDNIQPLCYSCNSSKGNRHSTDYRIGWKTAV